MKERNKTGQIGLLKSDKVKIMLNGKVWRQKTTERRNIELHIQKKIFMLNKSSK